MKPKSLLAVSYGICVIVSGLWRFFSAEGGHTGLIFGLVMGGLSMVAAFLLNRPGQTQTIMGHVVFIISLVLVGGWFFYEALIKKGLAVAELRQLIVIFISILTATALIFLSKKRASQDVADEN